MLRSETTVRVFRGDEPGDDWISVQRWVHTSQLTKTTVGPKNEAWHEPRAFMVAEMTQLGTSFGDHTMFGVTILDTEQDDYKIVELRFCKGK